MVLNSCSVNSYSEDFSKHSNSPNHSLQELSLKNGSIINNPSKHGPEFVSLYIEYSELLLTL